MGLEKMGRLRKVHGRGCPVPWLMSAFAWHLLTRSGLCKRREEPWSHCYFLKVLILGHTEDTICTGAQAQEARQNGSVGLPCCKVGQRCLLDGVKSPTGGSQATGSLTLVLEASWGCVICQQGLGTINWVGDNDQ